MMDYASLLLILVATGTGIAGICIGLSLFIMLKGEKPQFTRTKSTATKEKNADKHKFKT
jgi:hypothetical protein